MTPIPWLTWTDVEYGVLVDVVPGVRRIIAENPGKFTYTGTGTYVIGSGSVAVVDPGPDDQRHVDALLAGLAGETVERILITHTHRDHSPASRALAEATGAPIAGFGPHPPGDRRAGEGGDQGDEEPGDLDFEPDETLAHGDVVEGRGWQAEVLHTPGHISNHLCFGVRRDGADGPLLLTGDHVMGWSTTVIPPPDGDMAAYLRSLRLLFGRGDLLHLPTHGPPITEPESHVRALHAHRLEREAQILDQLAAGPATIPAIVVVLYAAVDERLHEAAGRSVLAHLVKLVEEGRVVGPERGDGDDQAGDYRLAG